MLADRRDVLAFTDAVGSHSPPSHKLFPEDGVNGMAAYDNSIRVTDEVIARIFEELRKRDPRSSDRDAWAERAFDARLCMRFVT